MGIKLYMRSFDGFSASEVEDIAANAIAPFAAHNIFFDVIYDPIQGPPPSGSISIGGLSTAHSHNDGIDVFLIKRSSLGGSAEGIPSLACFATGTYDGLTLTNLVAHEIGHCLGLHHTWRGFQAACNRFNEGCAESDFDPNSCFETGTSGYVCGDCVPDTPPDPWRWIPADFVTGCSYGECDNAVLIDDNCNIVNFPSGYGSVDVTNIMSYYRGFRSDGTLLDCRSRFSDGQASRIRKMMSFDNNGITPDYASIMQAFLADRIVIASDVVWDEDVEVCTDVYIKPGAQLEISATARIHGGVKFVVEQGGRLTLKGGTMTDAGTGEWSGVELWGTASAPQIPSGQHGAFVMIGGALFENSLTGVKAYSTEVIDKAATSGGRIIAVSSTFRNNGRAIDLLFPYEHNNFHLISNVDFEVNANYLGTSFREQVRLHSVNRIAFANCRFLNTSGLTFILRQGVAIKSLDSRFSVHGSNTEFKGFLYAIDAANTASARTFTVKDATFEDNGKGILARGVNHLSVKDCTFDIGGYGSSDLPAHDGVQLSECTGFTVSGNQFRGTGSYASRAVGVRAIDCGSFDQANFVVGNNFDDLQVANAAEGDNEGTVIQSGLRYECNDNLGSNAFDFWVASGGIAPIQRSALGESAGNTFSHNESIGVPSDFNNEGAFVQYYFYNDANDTGIWPAEAPQFYTESSVALFEAPRNACQGDEDGDTPSHEIPIVKERFKDYESTYAARKSTYSGLIDGGDTQGLIAAINTATAAQAPALYAQLSSISPYLSEQALTALIDKAEASGFPGSLLINLLSGNPEPVRRGGIVDYLIAGTLLTPAEIDTVAAYSLLRTDRDTLEAAIAQNYAGAQRQADIVLSYYLRDTVAIEMDSLLLWLDEKGGLRSAFLKSDLLLQEGSLEAAAEVLQNASTQLELTGAQATALEDKTKLLALLSGAQGGYLLLDSLQLDSLNGIAMGNGLAAVQAASLLDFAYDQPLPPSNALPAAAMMMAAPTPYKRPAAQPKETNLSLFPNPANDQIVVRYQFDSDVPSAQLVIFDVNGGKVREGLLPGTTGTAEVDVRSLPTGFYFYRVLVTATETYSGKIAIHR